MPQTRRVFSVFELRVPEKLHVEPEMDNVAIFDDVFLAFQTPLAGILGAGFALVLHEIIVADDFGADESPLEIGVNYGGGLGGSGADFHGPGADFLNTGGEVGLQAQQAVAGPDHAVEPRLVHAHFVQEHGFFFVFQFRNLGFQLVTDGDYHGVFGFCNFPHGIQVRVVLEAVFVHVGDVHGGLDGKQAKLANQCHLVFVQAHAANGFAFVQHRQQLFKHLQLGLGFLVAALGDALYSLDRFLDGVEVGQCQFGVDHFDVRGRVYLVGDVNHVAVFKAAHHVGDGVGLADVGQELVAQAFTLGCTGNQAGDVHEFHGGGNHALRLYDFRQLGQAGVRHGHHAGVRLDGAEGEVFRADAGFGQCVEQGGFADVGKADDAAVKSHGMPLLELKNLGGLYRCIGKGASKGLCPCSGSRFEAVQAVHSRGQFSAGSIGQYPHHFVEDGMELLGFLLAQAAQYVTGYLAAVAGVADAKA